MNNTRRKQIESLIDLVATLQADAQNITTVAEEIKMEEEDYRVNMPENLQNGDKAQQSDEAIQALEEAVQSLENLNNEIDCIFEYLNNAKGG